MLFRWDETKLNLASLVEDFRRPSERTKSSEIWILWKLDGGAWN
ncbi:MAG: hypothetical protein ACTS47_00935 [Candidatus Hodgkinia cicadicola]